MSASASGLSKHLLGEWDSPEADVIINETQHLYVLAEFHAFLQLAEKKV